MSAGLSLVPDVEARPAPVRRLQRPRRPRPVRAWAARHRPSIVVLLPVLVVVAAVHMTGMAGAPQRMDDEGTYVSQAWAIMHLNTLPHSTYWYDHPPVGWILTALYATVT